MPNTTIPFPPTCRVKLGFNSFSAFVSGAKSSWRVALNKGRTSSGSPMAAHGTRSWAKRQHHCHPGHHQAAEPSSHVVGLWTFLSHTGINIIYIILYQARKKKPNYTQARRRSGKKTKKKNIPAPCAHPIAGSAAFPEFFFWIHRLRKRCTAGCQFQRCGMPKTLLHGWPMDWLGVGVPVWPVHAFRNVGVLKHVFPPMPCSLEMIENQLRHSWMVNIFI